MYAALFKFHFRFTGALGFWKPGLEMKYACEEAESCGAKTYFLGTEFNQDTWQRLYHETRMNLVHYLYKRVQMVGNVFWDLEKAEVTSRL